MAAEDDSAARNPLGPVGQNVVANIRQLREVRKLAYTELSARLSDLGRPIPVLGLSRIERGQAPGRRRRPGRLGARARREPGRPAAAAGTVTAATRSNSRPASRYPAAVVWSGLTGTSCPGIPAGMTSCSTPGPSTRCAGS